MELRVKEILRAKGMTFGRLCELLEITPQSLRKSLTNNPTADRIEEVAKALDCEIHELFPAGEKFAHFYVDGEWLGIRKK